MPDPAIVKSVAGRGRSSGLAPH
jgi:hypothetical protein